MMFIYLLCLLFSAGVLLFVLHPFVGKGSEAVSNVLFGFSDEHELRSVLSLRDAFIEKLTKGDTSHELVKDYPEQACFEALVAICSRLRKAGLPYLPGVAALVGFVALIASILSTPALAQDAAAEQGSAPKSEMQVPEAFVMSDGALVARLHQFVLVPGDASLHVRYVGYFRWAGDETDAAVAFPLPAGINDFKVQNALEAVLLSSAGDYPTLRLRLKPGNVHFQAEFSLPAATGVAKFQNPTLDQLPGTTLFMMPEYQGGLRNFLQVFSDKANIWPARVATTPTGFDSSVARDSYDPSEPNYQMLIRMPPQFTRRMVRFGNDSSPYPSFEVVGIVPSRLILWAFVMFFAAILFVFALVAIRKFLVVNAPSPRRV